MTTDRKARIAGAFYLVTVVASLIAILVPAVAPPMFGVAGLAYIGVTLMLYFLFRAVAGLISLLAALMSLAGIAAGPVLDSLGIAHSFSIAMACFGVYLILLGYLIRVSGYLPGLIGLFLALGGLGYLFNCGALFALPALQARLYPGIFAPGFLAETLFCFWILVRGVKVPR